MGSYDGAEVCELVGLFILCGLGNTYGKECIGLYRDDGLAVFKIISGTLAEELGKTLPVISRTTDSISLYRPT